MQRLTFRHILTPDGILHDRTLDVGPDGRISAIGPASGPADGFLALPGMPNAHSHSFQRALAGYGEAPHGDDSFWSWRNAMYALAARITPEQQLVVARRAYAEMLRAGYTSVAEFHYLHHGVSGARGVEMAQALVEAANATGIRLVLLPVLYMAGGFGKQALPEQKRFVHRSIEDYLHLVERLKPLAPLGIAPHSLRAVPPHVIPTLVRDARELLGRAVPLHIHVAEQAAEVEQCRASHGCGPIELLARTVDLDARWNLVHATHADQRELSILRERDPTVVLCPITEAHLGDGLFPADEFARERGAFAIGSDANCRIDAFEELRLLEYGQRLRTRQRARFADSRGVGVPLWLGAVRGGARALGQSVGGVVVGQFADLAVIGEGAAALLGHGVGTALDALLINGSAADVSATYVGGVKRTPADDAEEFDRVVRKLHS